MRTLILGITLAAASATLAGCETPDPNFGVAVHQNLTAQIADPDARYARTLPPASDGSRTALAVTRYRKGQVIQPQGTSTSTIQMRGSSEGAAGGGAAGPN